MYRRHSSHRWWSKFCWLLLALMKLDSVSAQDLSVLFSGNTSRIVGNGLFFRQCEYTGSVSVTRLEWLRGDTVVLTGSTGVTQTILSINSPALSDGGEYHCRAILSNGMTQTISAGFLNVYTAQSITVPATQFVAVNTDINLECSSEIPGTTISWRDPQNNPISRRVRDASPSNEGTYSCVVIDTGSGGAPIFTVTTELVVIVPPTILERPSVNDHYTNEPANFTVSFRSEYIANTSVIWLRNNSALTNSTSVVVTSYTAKDTGTSTLPFSQLTRGDRGEYTVIIYTVLSVSSNTSFSVNVIVPPARPNTPFIENFDNCSLRITWNLPEHNADAAPDSFTVTIVDHSISPVHLGPRDRELRVHTEDRGSYVVTITAINVDGQNTSLPANLVIPLTCGVTTMSATTPSASTVPANTGSPSTASASMSSSFDSTVSTSSASTPNEGLGVTTASATTPSASTVSGSLSTTSTMNGVTTESATTLSTSTVPATTESHSTGSASTSSTTSDSASATNEGGQLNQGDQLNDGGQINDRGPVNAGSGGLGEGGIAALTVVGTLIALGAILLLLFGVVYYSYARDMQSAKH